MKHLSYERPDLVEIGNAEKLTLGCTGSCADSCDCAHCNSTVVVCLTPQRRRER